MEVVFDNVSMATTGKDSGEVVGHLYLVTGASPPEDPHTGLEQVNVVSMNIEVLFPACHLSTGRPLERFPSPGLRILY